MRKESRSWGAGVEIGMMIMMIIINNKRQLSVPQVNTVAPNSEVRRVKFPY
jgi:hypothetical protein